MTKYPRARLIAAVVVAFLCGLVFASGSNLTHLGWAQSKTPPKPTLQQVQPLVETQNAFEAIADHVTPAVVSIQTERFARSRTTPRQRGQQRLPGGIEDFFRQFDPQTDQPSEASGSGFIVSKDGYILTNNHVVGNANKISVTLSDGRKFNAELVGTDVETDIALIKINASGLPIAVLGDSDDVQQGDWVLALGSPFGLQQTLTAGIVSATGRELRESQYNHYIQTDASINPGNSGGPLVDMQGQVIGINTMILTGGLSSGNIGIGFAIAANTAREVFKQLAKGGRISRGYLGVLVTDLDDARAHALGLEPKSGVFVSDVPDSNSPAGNAGIKPKDVITTFNGKPVRAARELTDSVAATPVGQTARVELIRNGQHETVDVQLVERPKNVVASTQPPQGDDQEGEAQQGRLGIQGKTVTPEMIEQMKLKLKTPSGVFVGAVQPESPAADAGLQHGDVIHGFDRAEIKTVENLAEAARSAKPGRYLLEVERNGHTIFLTVTLE